MSIETAIAALEANAFARGELHGYQNATSISLGETGYGSGHHAVFVLRSSSKAMIRRNVKERHWRREGDNPGQAYMGTCEILRWHRDDSGEWTAICLGSTYYDV
jgi:hypothetical protein